MEKIFLYLDRFLKEDGSVVMESVSWWDRFFLFFLVLMIGRFLFVGWLFLLVWWKLYRRVCWLLWLRWVLFIVYYRTIRFRLYWRKIRFKVYDRMIRFRLYLGRIRFRVFWGWVYRRRSVWLIVLLLVVRYRIWVLEFERYYMIVLKIGDFYGEITFLGL